MQNNKIRLTELFWTDAWSSCLGFMSLNVLPTCLLSKTSLKQFNSSLNISSTTLETWQFFLAIQCHLYEQCLLLTILQFIAYCSISVYITLWGIWSTTHVNLLMCLWRCLRAMSLVLNTASFFARIFLLTSQTPQEGICPPKKVTRSAKFCLPLAGYIGTTGLI